MLRGHVPGNRACGDGSIDDKEIDKSGFVENVKERTQMEYKTIPCVEGDDEFIAYKLNEITDSKIDFEDT